MDTIKLPGVGPVKKEYVIAGAAVTAGIVGYAWFRRKNANAAAASADTSTTTQAPDPSSAIDPSTGLTYAEESADNSTGYGYSGYGGYGGASDGQSQYGYDIYGNPIPAPTGLGSGGALTTNDEWATQAEADLLNAGVTQAVSATAIGRVLAGLTVTTDQQGYFLQAVGLLGQPPQGYPTPIKVSQSATGTPPTGTPVPNNVPNASFYTVHSATTWALVARSEGVFAGNGSALYQYNLLPGKHDPGSYAKISATRGGAIKKNPGFTVAIPQKGHKIQLPGVGVVTS